MVAALTVPMALSGCSLFAESTNASSSPTPSASASFEVLSSPPAGASDEPSESAAELTQPSKSSEQSPEPSPTRSRSGAATDPNTPQSISTEDASTPEPRPEATGLYSGGFGEGTSVWQVSGAQGGATTAGVAVRKGSKVCFTIGEYEAVGFYGSAQATETDQFLTGTNFGIDSGPAEYRVTGQGALVVTHTGPSEQYSSNWSQIDKAAAAELLASHIPGSDGKALYDQLVGSAQGNCS